MSEQEPEGQEPIEITHEEINDLHQRQWEKFTIGEDGQIYTSDGIKVNPDHSVGERPDQKELFIEYEWTFGRGKAKYETHRQGGENTPQTREIVDDYRKIRDQYLNLVSDPNADLQEIAQVKEEIITFRQTHPELYKERKPIE